MLPGEIYRHDTFYVDPESGEWRRKYFAVLAPLPSGDFVVRLLTSKSHGRPEDPRCTHGHPYPSYFLGVLGGELGAKSWVDLRYLDDVDPSGVRRLTARKVIIQITEISKPLLMPLLECAAGAEDTTQRQERAIRDQLAMAR